MTFEEAFEEAKQTPLKMIRRKTWPDGVVGEIKEDKILWQHVAACALNEPEAHHFEGKDWIAVKDWGKDLSYDWKGN